MGNNKPTRECWIENNVCNIPLSNGKTAICDSEHYDNVRRYIWFVTGRNSCAITLNKKRIFLHKFLFPNLIQTIFLNGNSLDCRKCNILEERRAVEIKDNICLITMGNGEIAICDADRYEEVRIRNWNRTGVKNNYYPTCRIKGKNFKMHKLLFPEIKFADHINGNRLDNRKENIREADNSQNSRNSRKPRNNSSGYKGVGKSRTKGKWVARIKFNNELIHLGTFSDIILAAKEYDRMAKELFKEFARLNFPDEK